VRLLRWFLAVALVAAGLAFVWALLAPRRKAQVAPTPSYVAPPPADDGSVSVPEAIPLDVPSP
jgi:hypothetical protein